MPARDTGSAAGLLTLDAENNIGPYMSTLPLMMVFQSSICCYLSVVRMAGDCAEPTPQLSAGPDEQAPSGQDAAEQKSHVDVNDPIYQVQHACFQECHLPFKALLLLKQDCDSLYHCCVKVSALPNAGLHLAEYVKCISAV